MPVAGVDVGSVAAKAVIFDPQSRSLLGKAVLPTGWNAREAGEKALAAACADAGGIAASRIVGTGYGRISLPFAGSFPAGRIMPGSGIFLPSCAAFFTKTALSTGGHCALRDRIPS